MGFTGIRGDPERRTMDPARHRPDRPPPLVPAQPVAKRIEIGQWRQANVSKVGLQFESILIRGLMNYTFWVPNGSPEYRYCLHEAAEECNHTMMFQEMVNRIGSTCRACPGCCAGFHR